MVRMFSVFVLGSSVLTPGNPLACWTFLFYSCVFNSRACLNVSDLKLSPRTDLRRRGRGNSGNFLETFEKLGKKCMNFHEKFDVL